MADTPFKRTAQRSYAVLKWLLALLIILALLGLLYYSDDAQQYGEKALDSSQGFVSRVTHKSRQVYACITSDCSLRVAPKNDTKTLAQTTADNRAASPAAPLASLDNSATPPCPLCPGLPPYLDLNTPGASSPVPSAAAENTPAAAPFAQDMGDVSGGRSPAAMPPAYPYYPGMAQAGVMPQALANPEPPAVSQPAIAPEGPAPATPAAGAAAPANTLLSKEKLRARYWAQQKNYAFAIIAYKKHLALHPNDLDTYGEMGNVYMIEKQYPQAAQSYYQISKQLLATGQSEAILPLLPIISQYEPKLAAELRAQLPALTK